MKPEKYNQAHWCSTAHCIAGEMVRILDPKGFNYWSKVRLTRFNEDKYYDYRDSIAPRASAALGITPNSPNYDRLFGFVELSSKSIPADALRVITEVGKELGYVD